MRVLALALVLLGLAAIGGSVARGAPQADPPTLTASPSTAWTQETTATFTFTSPYTADGATFECDLDGGGFAPCLSGYTTPTLGEKLHTFQVRTTDGVDVSPPAPSAPWSWTVDTTPPALSLPGDQTREATSSAGAVVTFSRSATDHPYSPPPVSCVPASGSVFALGTTDVTCTATDLAGNSASGSFAVTVQDTTAPVVSPPADKIVAQQSAAGAVVTYAPTATDTADPSPLVTCTPPSGYTFPFATTPVTCYATDASGNESATVGFDVVVQRGAIPPKPSLAKNVGKLTRKTSVTFTFSVDAGLNPPDCKLVGPSGTGSFAPCSSPTSESYSDLAEGSYRFTVQVSNSVGNVALASRAWTVDRTAPPPAARFRTRAGAGRVKLLWRAFSDSDYHHVVISRERAGSGKWRSIGTRRTATRFVDRNVRNDVRYVYKIRSVDRAGNRSQPARGRARPSKVFLPQWGAVRQSPPRIDWVGVSRASYYNLQLWRSGRKILSAWPLRSTLRLHSSWTFRGRTYSLGPARYVVYVWPGFGRKSAAKYGRMAGWTSFSMK